jgi:hypothetical protein
LRPPSVSSIFPEPPRPPSAITFGIEPGLFGSPFPTAPPSRRSSTYEARPEEDFPAVPESIDCATQDSQDRLKYSLISNLRAYHRYIRNLRLCAPEDRLEKQRQVEERFVASLQIFRTKLGIDWPYCVDETGTVVYAPLPKEFREQVSRRTSLYNSEVQPNAPELAQGPPNIRFPADKRLPADLTEDLMKFYRGEYEPGEGYRAAEFVGIEMASFWGTQLCYLCLREREHRLVVGGTELATGFFGAATSMFVSEKENVMWVAADVRVKQFDLERMQVTDWLFVRDEVVPQSAMTVWGNRVVLAFETTIYSWEIGAGGEVGETLDAGRYGVEGLEAVDWTKGRPPTTARFAVALPKITAIAGVGEFLAVASSEYEAIHVFSETSDGEIAVRLVGHTMGINCLLAHKDQTLLSGSIDRTTKQWNVLMGSTEFTFVRHGAPVTAITFDGDDRAEFMFTAGEDGFVRGWDLTHKQSMFEVSIGQDNRPVALTFRAEQRELHILCQVGEPSLRQYTLQSYTFS